MYASHQGLLINNEIRRGESKFYGNHASHKSNYITLTRLC